MHDNNDINDIAEFILLHYILSPSKRVKSTNYCYLPILHVRINTRRQQVKVEKFRILLDSGFSSTIVTRRL